MAKKKRTNDESNEEMASLLKEIKTEDLFKYKISIKCKTEKQKEFLNQLKDKNNEICFGIGSAGSGKSFISLGYALKMLKEKDNEYSQLIIIVPTVEAGAMNIGYLKGTIEEKTEAYQAADKFTMSKILKLSGNAEPDGIVAKLVNNGSIRYELVNFARGKTFDNCIILINEAENYSRQEMLLLLTRIGENCKIICTGDEEQMDRKDIKKSNSKSGMLYAIEKLNELQKVSSIEFDNNDIVRNPLIGKIIELWNK
jgi:phosphate starvation-inducible PhoH-like protein